MEVETDEARQRGMKGNLIITSSTRDNKISVFTNKEIEKEGVMKKEDNLEMILRVVKEKTGVSFKPSEAACHPLGRRQEAAGGAQGGQEQVKKHPHSWILRIWDRKPGSNWEILKTGMKYGKGFDEKYNLNVSYMLTQSRSKLSQRAREVKSKLNSERKLKKDEVQPELIFKVSMCFIKSLLETQGPSLRHVCLHLYIFMIIIYVKETCSHRSIPPIISKKYQSLPNLCRSKVDNDMFKEEFREHLVPKRYKFLARGSKLDVNC